MTMTVDEVRALKPGDLVRVLIPASGATFTLWDSAEYEWEMPAGAVARVTDVSHYGRRQGWGVTLAFDQGVTNLFDEGDPDAFALERVEDSPALRLERVQMLLQSVPEGYPPQELAGDVQGVLKGAEVMP